MDIQNGSSHPGADRRRDARGPGLKDERVGSLADCVSSVLRERRRRSAPPGSSPSRTPGSDSGGQRRHPGRPRRNGTRRKHSSPTTGSGNSSPVSRTSPSGRRRDVRRIALSASPSRSSTSRRLRLDGEGPATCSADPNPRMLRPETGSAAGEWRVEVSARRVVADWTGGQDSLTRRCRENVRV